MKQIILVSAILILFSSCNREPKDVINYQPPIINTSIIEVTGGLKGSIKTNGNQPVEDAKVSIKGYETTTDENGKFSFENVSLFQDGTFIEVEKPGYYLGSRKIYAIESELNVMELELIPLDEEISISSFQSNNVEKGGLSIDLPSGEYQLGANGSFEGEMNVYITTIESNDEWSYNKMPGDLTGLDESYELKALSSLGIFNVSITSQSNELMQLPLNSLAEIQYKFVESNLGLLPPVVSLYYFDQANGTWIERSDAILNIDSYIGQIDALGYWMLAVDYPYANITGSLKSPDDMYNETRMRFFNQSNQYSNFLNPTFSGKYSSRVPQGIDLDLTIFHQCAAGNQVEKLGSISQDEIIDEVVIATNMENIHIEGSVEDCQGNIQDNSFIRVSFSEKQYLYRIDEDGKFDHSFANCSDSSLSITAFNTEHQEVSDVIDIGVSNEINVGDIVTCNQVVAGYEVSYENMDWKDELENSADHSWQISRISGANSRLIFRATIVNKDTGEEYLKAVFVITDGEPIVDYQLTFTSQSFNLFGQCELEEVDHGAIKSYRFFGAGNDIVSTDAAVIISGIDTVNFSLVYYD